MARTTAVQLTGEDLTPADVWEIAVGGAAAELDDSAREKMRASRAVVERAAEAPEKTYGVNTGFGQFVNRAISKELVEELQLRLLRSHACGVGDPYPDEIVRAAIVMRANTLAKGYSGVRVEVAELLLALLECRSAAARSEPWLGGGQRRSRPARAPRAATRGRGQGTDRRRAGLRR